MTTESENDLAKLNAEIDAGVDTPARRAVCKRAARLWAVTWKDGTISKFRNATDQGAFELAFKRVQWGLVHAGKDVPLGNFNYYVECCMMEWNIYQDYLQIGKEKGFWDV